MTDSCSTRTAPAIDQLADLALAALEQEYWAGRNSRACLAAAPMAAVIRFLLPPSEPPQPPQQQADAEHQRLYGDALAAWTQLQHARSRFEALVDYMQEQLP